MSSVMEQMKEKIGFNPLILIGGLVVSIYLIFIGQSEKYVTALTGIIFPCYMSLKAIDSEGKDDDKQWCTYWVVFFLFILAELYFGYFLHYIPFYFLIKVVFLIWLFFPATLGACYLYENFLSKLFSKYEKDLDDVVDGIGKSVSRGYDGAKKTLNDSKGQIISGAMNAASKISS